MSQPLPALSLTAQLRKQLELQEKVVTTEEWGDVAFSQVEDDTFVLWSCNGDVAAVLREAQDGSLVRVESAAYNDRYNLFAIDMLHRRKSAAT